jgi:hypothetical protein
VVLHACRVEGGQGRGSTRLLLSVCSSSVLQAVRSVVRPPGPGPSALPW